MIKELKNIVKFHVEIYNPCQGIVWTQEFIKPLVNYVGMTINGYGTLNSGETNDSGTMVGVYDLFNNEVMQTINTYGAEKGWGFELVMNDIRSEKLSVMIGFKDAHGDTDGYFDFYKDRGNSSEDYKEVEEILKTRMNAIREEDGFDFGTPCGILQGRESLVFPFNCFATSSLHGRRLRDG